VALSHASAVREGGGEALIGVVRAGLLSREITCVFGVLTLSCQAEGHVVGGAIRESPGDPARSEIPGTYEGLHAREPGDPVVDHGSLVMPRPGWFAGWQTGGRWSAGGTFRR